MDSEPDFLPSPELFHEPAAHPRRSPSPDEARPYPTVRSARDLLAPLRRAIDLHLRGDLDGAERRLRAVLALDDRLPQGHHHLAVVLHCQGRTVEALRHMREAVALDPHLPGAEERLAGYVLELAAERERESA